MQISESAPKVEGALNTEGTPNVEGALTTEGAPKVEGTEYCSGFYREAGFYDAHSLPDYGAQSPVTREAFAYDFFPAAADSSTAEASTVEASSPAPLLVWVHGAPGASAPTRPYATLSCAPLAGSSPIPRRSCAPLFSRQVGRSHPSTTGIHIRHSSRVPCTM